jgi:hypothetical protein
LHPGGRGPKKCVDAAAPTGIANDLSSVIDTRGIAAPSRLVNIALEWQARFGVAPPITSAISELDAIVLSNPLTGLRRLTVAFATTAPVESLTVPTTEVELPPDCAWRWKPNKKRAAIAANRDFAEEVSMIPPREIEVAK